MKRREYLLSELPAELRPDYEAASFGLPMVAVGFTAVVGFTLDGIRYRIYPNAEIREKNKHIFDLQDALRGADVPTEQVEAAMDRFGYTPDERRQTWAEIAERQRETAEISATKAPASDRRSASDE